MSVFKRWNGEQWITIGPGISSARFEDINNMIAPEYNPQKTYEVGDYVVQSDKLYRCIHRIATAQSWNIENWLEIKLGPDVTNLRNNIIIVNETQPTTEDNKIWIAPDNNNIHIPLVEDVLMLPHPNDYGENDQIPRSTGSGIEWVDYGLPSDQQVEDAINTWLDNHPEATTTVQDHSLTYEKLVNGTLNFVTPEMYGAYGDGDSQNPHDDSDAIQDAIDSGYCIYFDKSYIISKAININTSCTLIGDRNNFIKQISNNTNSFVITNPEYVIIDSLHLIGVGTDYSPSSGGKNTPVGIKISGDSNDYIKSVHILNCILEKHSWSNLTISKANNVKILSNIIIGTGINGSMQVDDNYQFGLSVNHCNNINIEKNDISYTAQGMYLGKELKNIIIKDNIIHDITGQHGIYSTYADGYIVANNIIRNITYAGIKIQHDDNTIKNSSNILVDGNIFDTVGQQGFMTTDVSTLKTYKLTDINVSNNIFNNCAIGLTIAQFEKANILNNIFIGRELNILSIHIGNGNNIVISDNKTFNYQNGIVGRSNSIINDITINKNIFKNINNYDINFQDSTATNITLTDNFITSTYGLPNSLILGNSNQGHIYFAPKSSLETVQYNTGDIIYFSDADTVGYTGVIINKKNAYVYFGDRYLYVDYPFSSSSQSNWTINNIKAYSNDKHTLYIEFSVTCNVRGTDKTLGTFIGIPTHQLPANIINLATTAIDGYNIKMSASGAISGGGGIVGETYTKTVKLVDGAVVTE